MSESARPSEWRALQLRPHTLMLQRGDTSPTQWVTTPIDVGALVDNFFRVSVGNPQRETSESPIPGTGWEVNELDVGP